MFKSQPFVQTRYYGPTNYRSPRVKAWHITNPKRSTVVLWDHALNERDNHENVARMVFAGVPDWTFQGEMLGASVHKGGYIFTFAKAG